MSKIIPAVIPDSKIALEVVVQEMTFAPRIQIDVVDGVFAPACSWPYQPSGDPKEVASICTQFTVMVDIMAMDQLAAAQAWLAAGAKEIVVHVEAVADMSAIVALKEQYDFLLFVAADDETPIEAYITHAHAVDGWQVMGIDQIGAQGEPFSPRVLDNIAALKLATPTVPVVVDGSVNKDTLPKLVTAGADAFVVGSAIMAADDKEKAYQDLVALA